MPGQGRGGHFEMRNPEPSAVRSHPSSDQRMRWIAVSRTQRATPAIRQRTAAQMRPCRFRRSVSPLNPRVPRVVAQRRAGRAR